MRQIAITGAIGSGKSLLGRILAQKSYPTLSADSFVKLYFSPDHFMYLELKKLLPPQFFAVKTIDRYKLAKFLFSNLDYLSQIEALLHPQVIKDLNLKIDEIKKSSKSRFCFIEIPLLFEKNLQKLYDASVLIVASQKVRYKRLIEKGFLEQDIALRDSRFLDEKQKRKLANFVIENNKSLSDLESAVELFLKNLHSYFD